MNVSRVETNLSQKQLTQTCKTRNKQGFDAVASDKTSVNEIPSSKLQGAYGITPSFGQIRLDTVNLKKKTFGKDKFKFVQAAFSELEPKNMEDQEKMFRLQKEWQKTRLGDMLTTDFLHNVRPGCKYYILEEMPKNGSKNSKVTNLMELVFPSDKVLAGNEKFKKLKIEFVQSAPQIADKKNAKIRGSGELALYETVKMAKEQNLDAVELFSINNDFYDRMGFEMTRKGSYGTAVYELPSARFNEFLERVEKKYNLKDVK